MDLPGAGLDIPTLREMLVPCKKWIILHNENYCIPVAFALTAAHSSSTASLSGFALPHEVPKGWYLGRPLAVFCITEIRAIFILKGVMGLSKILENNSAYEICGGEE